MRWLFWTGGVVALAGLVWLIQDADVATGGNVGAAVGGGALLLLGLVMAGIGMGVGREPDDE